MARRDFVKALGAGLPLSFFAAASPRPILKKGAAKYGPLQKDPTGTLLVPKRFSCHIFSRAGERMDDGYWVPGAQDGMGAFDGGDGRVLLVRNHELSPGDKRQQPFFKDQQKPKRPVDGLFYDQTQGGALLPGGTTTILYDTQKGQLERHYLSLTGTVRNCAGGTTPWGTWLSCEETTGGPSNGVEKHHGYCFEVNPKAGSLSAPKPIKALGRFRHEAVAIDPDSGIVYLTEDRGDSLFYRFIPKTADKLEDGGQLQALVIDGQPGRTTANQDLEPKSKIAQGTVFDVSWIDLDDPENLNDDLRLRGRKLGAAAFTRGEGLAFDGKTAYFTCTNGGPKGQGQVWRYRPDSGEKRGEPAAKGQLELFLEPQDGEKLSMPDNICVSPQGDLIIAEDSNRGSNRLIAVTPEGEIFTLAQLIGSRTELAGCCFSPDGKTLFFNIFHPGATVALQGPWR